MKRTASGIFIAITSLFICQSLSAQYKNPETDTIRVLDPYFAVDSDQLTSNPTLNVFFGNKIASYLSESGDLNLTKGYALLDNSDGRLFLGGSFILNRKKKTDALNTLLTLGVKANIKEGFSTLYSKGLKNDIGISGKFTLFGNGSLFYNADASQKMKVAQQRIIMKTEMLEHFDSTLSGYKIHAAAFSFGDSLSKAFIKKQIKSMGGQFPEQEASAIDENNWYNLGHTWWLSVEAYVPVTGKQYYVSPSFANKSFDTTLFKPYEGTVTYTNFWEKKVGKGYLPQGKYYLIVSGSLLAYNNILSEKLEQYSYGRYLSQGSITDTSFMAVLKDEKVYVGDYDPFVSGRLRGRFVYMPWSFIGISAGIEKYFSPGDAHYSPLNWKLGIPVSLKDNDGKPKVNFELQWREINGLHSVGLSVAFAFGGNVF